jgi:phosphoribosylglycinamide formyltransferase-1
MGNLRVAVLLSGSGTTLENLFQKRDAGELSVEIVVVVSSRADAYGLERARQRNVPTAVVERCRHRNVEEFSTLVFDVVTPYQPDLVCLAGFMSLLVIPSRYDGRVLNVHPALLPAFGGKGYYGHHVHEAVLQAGCTVSGCTVHFVDQAYDHGQIVAQQSVPVLPNDTPDTLAARVQAAERELYPRVIQSYAEGRIRLVRTKNENT